MSFEKTEIVIDSMDSRICLFLDKELGFPLVSFPTDGIELRESPKRSDDPRNRLRIVRIGNAAVVTAIPRILEAVTPAICSMSIWELFSPLGEAELARALGPDDGESLCHAFEYILSDPQRFRPAVTPHEPVALTKKDIPPEQFEDRMSERRQPVADDFVWAFACYHDDSDAKATELAPFGPRCASIAIVIWNEGPDIATYGLGTEAAYQGRRYALATVSAATQYILDQGTVAHYEAFTSNIPSLRIPRRLGFSLVWQEIKA